MSKKPSKISDDELLNQCIKENQQCFHTSCSNSIKLIGLKCHLCTKVFCPSHLQPEVHGCGLAARKDAAKDAPKPVSNEKKAAELEKKMNKKLQQMKNDRKKKGK